MISITRTTTYTITCTDCKKQDSVSIESFQDDARDATRVFRANGWHIGKKHLCPDCVKKAKEVGNAGSN